MKHSYLIILFVCTTHIVFGQEKTRESIQNEILESLDEMGKDNSSVLNEYEGKYLNYFFNESRKTFDFCGKKLFFLKGNIGTKRMSKKEYFYIVKWVIENKGFTTGFEQLMIFNEDEVKQVGYNAVIIVGSKKYLNKNEVMKRIKKIDGRR